MRAIITGAASGIGRATAHRLARDAERSGRDISLALLDIDTDGAEVVAAEVRGARTDASAIEVDLARRESVVKAVETALSTLDGLDALVSNAGIVAPGLLSEVDEFTWDQAFAVNTKGALLLAQASREALSQSSGSIVITSSLAAVAPTAGVGAYSASKAAVRMLAQQIAREWGPEGIRCNSVAPGSILTPMTEAGLSNDSSRRLRNEQIPLGRVGEPDDVAAVIAFLIGPDARYVTGADIPVDGGWGSALMPRVAGTGSIK